MKESAVYARQSVEKKNSLSIEGQIDLCCKTAGRELKIYTDRGFSGKNTKRPAFQRLMRDIREDRIDRLYVYRLDRFSRSVADFGGLWEVLREHGVEFTSVSESFDTASPMGRAMLHIIMVFAQLERETTAERVRDNYYKRASLGSWPGGPAPYGFTIGRKPNESGRPVPALLPDPARTEIVKRIFEKYARDGESLGSVARMLNAAGIPAPRRGTWDSVAVSRLLHSPVYVSADEQVRLHYLGAGASVTSDAAAFDGQHGLLLIGRRDRSRQKQNNPQAQSVSVLNSEGLVDADLWLACQSKLQQNRQIGNAGKGTHTWLTGLLKCASCGYSLKVSGGKDGRRLYCSGRYNLSKCREEIRVDISELETEISGCLQELLDECVFPVKSPESDTADERLAVLQRKADRLLLAYSESSEMTAEYLHRAMHEIENERRALIEARRRSEKHIPLFEKPNFPRLSFEEKKSVASLFISRISLADETAEIRWNI